MQYDRNLQKPHLLEVITNINGSVHVLRWKKVLIANPADFRISVTNLQNTAVDVKSNSHVLLAFKKVNSLLVLQNFTTERKSGNIILTY